MVKEKGLIDACRNGNIQLVEKTLNKWKKVGPLASLRRSCDVNIADQSGYSSLHHAALNGHKEIVGLLLGHGARPNVVDGKGSSPLHLSAWAGHGDVVKLLLTFGHRSTLVNLTNVDGDTPLHYATQFGHTQCCQHLLKYGADPAVKNAKGEAPLDLAAFYGRVETVETMLRTHPELLAVYRHSSPNDIFSSTPLHLASRNGHKAVVDVLVSSGMPISTITQSGSALHEASMYGKVDVAKRLVELGIDISVINVNGETVDTCLKILGTPAAQQILTYIQGCGALVQVSVAKKRDLPFVYPQSPGSPYENIILPEKVHPKKKHNRSSSVDILLDDEPKKEQEGARTRRSEEREISRRHFKSVSSTDSLKWSTDSGPKDDGTPAEGSIMITPERSRAAQITRGSRAYSSLNYGGTKQVNGNGGERRSLDYFAMSGTQVKKISPRPPVKPPRRVNNSESEVLNRRTAYELIYLAHSGAIDGVCTDRNLHHPDYVDMCRMTSSCYENIGNDTSHSDLSGQILPLVHHSADFLDEPIRSLDSSAGPIRSADTKENEDALIERDHFSAEPVRDRALVHRSADFLDEAVRSKNFSAGPMRSVETGGKEIVHPMGSQEFSAEPIRDRAFSVGPIRVKDFSTESKDYDSDKVRSWYFSAGQRGEQDFCSAQNETRCRSTTSSPRLGHKPIPLPRKFVSRSYENVLEHSSSLSLPSTPDHPPPHPEMAEENIFGYLPKRKSRDIETETDIPMDISREDSLCYDGGSCTNVNSDMDLSVSVEYVEEYVTDSPFEGLVRCSFGHHLDSFADTLSLPTPSGMTQSPSRVDFGTSTESPRRGSKALERSLTILSPFDENEEWTKITEILGSFGGNMGPDSILAKDLQKEFQERLGISESDEPAIKTEISEVGDWLKEVSLQQYGPLLDQNGFDNLDFVGSGLLDDTVLIEMGVVNALHRQTILAASAQLHARFPAQLPESVDAWLASLNLTCYADTFHKHLYLEMEKVKKMWEIELVTLLEIVKPGHIRRILFSLGAQSRFAPSDPVRMIVGKSDLKISDEELTEVGLSVDKLREEIDQKLPHDLPKKPYGTLGRSTLGRKKNRPPPPPDESKEDPQPRDLDAPEGTVTRRSRVDGLTIRGPKELLIGFTAPVISQWKHENAALVNSSVQYIAEYLGTTRVLELKGTESTKRSIQKLKKKYENKKDNVRKVALAISHRGVSFMHPDFEETICEHVIRNIHCACQDADDLTHFAYITQDQIGSNDHFCHVFRVDTMDLATEVILTLGQAFEVAFQLALGDEKVRCHIRSKSAYEMSTPFHARGHGRTTSENSVTLTVLKASLHADNV